MEHSEKSENTKMQRVDV